MSDALRLLQVEDSESDAALIVRLLEKAQYDVRAERVEDPADMRAALEREVWDVIIADYHLPRFDAPAALQVLHDSGQDIPFIVVSGNLGEDVAVAMMRAGAHDYLMKGSLVRLAPAVAREIREAGDRRQRTRAEEARRISDERLAAIIGSALDAIITVDEQQRIVVFNAAAERTFGCSAADAIGKPLDGFIPERFVEIHRQHIQAFGSTEQVARFMQSARTIYGRRANGDEFPLEATVSHASSLGHRLYTVILRDITERKRAEEVEKLYFQSQELDRLKTEFFANISHELRTPLALILGPVGKILNSAGIHPETRHGLEQIQRNARLLLRYVNDLLDLSKLEAGRMTVEYAVVDLARTVRLAASNFESLARERGVGLVVETPGSLTAEVDAPKIERVLLNLLSNAFKFTPAGGTVRIAVRGVDARTVVEVEDTGPGVPKDRRDVIFERFSQLENGPGHWFGGTGLGLSIARQLVGLHGGGIAVEEAASHGGALFRVELPLVAPGGAEVRRSAPEADLDAARLMVDELQTRATAGPRSGPEASPSAPVVLLVEDNPEMNAFIAETLTPAFRVVSTFDGQEGLEKALEARPDLILTDIMMPRMSGDRLVREIRARPELEDVPIVLLTAKTDEDLRVRLLRAGAQDYLHKPFDARALLAKVDRMITDSRRRKQTEEALHQLSGNLLQVRDEERKRIAQELHENTIQCLAAVQMNLAAARTGSLSPEAQQILDDGYALLDQCSMELRTLSYGLHPPLLDHFGLRAAMESHVKKFLSAGGIRLSADIPRDLGRLPAEHELALFRVMQESLINLRCHPGIGKAEVRVFRDASEVGLEVIAEGWPPGEPGAEIGVAALRERVRMLGGRLDIVSADAATIVRAALPLPHAAD